MGLRNFIFNFLTVGDRAYASNIVDLSSLCFGGGRAVILLGGESGWGGGGGGGEFSFVFCLIRGHF